jgi:DNA polymerase
MTHRATVDFESRSACNLKKSGSWKYSLDPTTQVLCMAFRLPHWKKGRIALWTPAFPQLGMEERGVEELVELFNWIIEGELVEAHNAWFERGLWQNILVPKFGWPAIAGHRWRCSAAKAAAHALPRGLDDAAYALGLKERKDAVGGKVMMKLNKPRKPRKAEVEAWQAEHGKRKAMPLLWHESPELFQQLFDYCRQDVLVEEAVSAAVPDLSESEQQLYTLDQTINERGFLLDMEAVSVALELIAAETGRLNAELKELTGGSPDKGTQRKKMHDWFLNQWFILEDTKAGTVDEALKRDDLTPTVRRGLELLQALSRSSTAKYEAMRNWANGDGRVRGGLLYHGASTGRWSGAGVQPHNFPRGTVKDIEGAWVALKTKDRAVIEAFNPKGG